ncbi:hypothetical protein TIFTF001_011994 [Ficus carica]|uniref:Uncharacterized protein n=1 Tax=Ficus carica TaxID=3494 RepID=A0AA88AMP0_FICCA|nr:hypothetical protein TIFTF001_011994 [Ficus carica]
MLPPTPALHPFN